MVIGRLKQERSALCPGPTARVPARSIRGFLQSKTPNDGNNPTSRVPARGYLSPGQGSPTIHEAARPTVYGRGAPTAGHPQGMPLPYTNHPPRPVYGRGGACPRPASMAYVNASGGAPRGYPVTAIILIGLVLLLAACAPAGGSSDTVATTPTAKPASTATPERSPTSTKADVCPAQLSAIPNCYTPHALRVAYGVEALTERGLTGKGQTVVDIVSFGSPTLQQDMDVFDKQFGLPPLSIKVLAPLGTARYDPTNKDMVGWGIETELDVQIIHAMAPDAGIVVLTSPVDETEGTVGLPEFLQLEQYAVAHQLGQIFSQSYVASEVTLADSAGRQLVKKFTDFYNQITIKQGWTIVSGSGDHGATDFSNIAETQYSPTPIVNFPADVPWVTAVGGTTLMRSANGYIETAWPDSGGGFSKFFNEPDFQKSLPQTVQSQLNGRRGLPDIAADTHTPSE